MNYCLDGLSQQQLWHRPTLLKVLVRTEGCNFNAAYFKLLITMVFFNYYLFLNHSFKKQFSRKKY